MSDWVARRLNQEDQHAFPLLREMFVEPGTEADWDQLHQFHYKSEGRVMGPRYYRVSMGKRLVAVAVMCYPRGLLKDRHKAFPGIKPGSGETKMSNTWRFKWLNETFSLNARTVNDTLFRGVGVGYRLLNLAARMDGRRFCEIQSSMSRFNEFAHRAGFQFVKPTPSKYHDKAIEMYSKWFDANPVDQVALLEEFNAMGLVFREKALRDLREFYFKASSLEKTGSNRTKGTSRVDQMSARDVVRNLNQLAFSMPLYGVYKNPDWGRKLPSRIPLLAFDEQPVTEPLKFGSATCE